MFLSSYDVVVAVGKAKAEWVAQQEALLESMRKAAANVEAALKATINILEQQLATKDARIADLEKTLLSIQDPRAFMLRFPTEAASRLAEKLHPAAAPKMHLAPLTALRHTRPPAMGKTIAQIEEEFATMGYPGAFDTGPEPPPQVPNVQKNLEAITSYQDDLARTLKKDQ